VNRPEIHCAEQEHPSKKGRIFNSNDPSRVKKKGGIPWLWVISGILVLYTWSCGSDARINVVSREAAGQL